MLSLDAKIEAILFFNNEPLSKKTLAKILETEIVEIEEALLTLEERLKESGLVLLSQTDKVALGATPEMSAILESLKKEELLKTLGKAGLETLSIILYKGPISRAKIDYIRGVNSTFILRNLLIRDLVERMPNADDQRAYLYSPSFKLLSFLGISKVDDLPEYVKIQAEVEEFDKGVVADLDAE